MAVIVDGSLLHIEASIGGEFANCLMDSGASHNFLSSNWCEIHGLEPEVIDHFEVRLADGQEVSATGKICCTVDFGP